MQSAVLLGNSSVAGGKSGLLGALFGFRRPLERFPLLDLLEEKVYQRQTLGNEREPFAKLKTCPWQRKVAPKQQTLRSFCICPIEWKKVNLKTVVSIEWKKVDLKTVVTKQVHTSKHHTRKSAL